MGFDDAGNYIPLFFAKAPCGNQHLPGFTHAWRGTQEYLEPPFALTRYSRDQRIRIRAGVGVKDHKAV
jgi:hypothetical protein